MKNLHAPFALPNGTVLKNRLAVAPMTTTQSHPDGTVSPAESAWLTRLAADGYGMVITCAAAISKESIAFENQMSLGEDRFLPDLMALANGLKAYGALGVVQLCHGGSRAIVRLTGVEARSASAYDLPGAPGFVRPKAFSMEEIHQLIEDHAAAARRAAHAGFGGVELHGANGYLFTQFLSTMTNQRQDAFGGSLENRARLARKVVRAIRERVPSDFVVGFRMSFEGMGLETGLDLDENIQVMNWLAEDGIDYGHISHLNLAAPSVKYPGRIALEIIRNGVDSNLPLMCAGGVFSAEDAEQALDLGGDLIAVGRAAIGNDQVPARLARRESLLRTPYSEKHLMGLEVSANLMGYLTAPGPLSAMKIMG